MNSHSFIFRDMSASTSFSGCIPRLSMNTLKAINEIGFSQMTPVQAASIPLFLTNKDVLVEAVTGSGKTLAFGIPIFEILNRSQVHYKKYDIGALVIAPTRELATQIFDVFESLSRYHSNIKSVLCVGGTSVTSELENYEKNGGCILIGTPGRILDMYSRSGEFNFKSIEVLVLDEADTLLDMGFKQSINDILALLPKQRRTGLFSATQTKEVKELARAGMRNPVSITVKVQSVLQPMSNASTSTQHQTNQLLMPKNSNQTVPSTLQNYYMISEYDDRPKHLLDFLRNHRNDKIIVFCSTCACVDYYGLVFRELAHDESVFPVSPSTSKSNKPNTSKSAIQNQKPPLINITTFHGKMVPKKRNALYKKFLDWESGVLFSTDVAARGIDIPDIDWIVQLAAPKDPSFFIHRVGRTARAGRSGGALIYLTEEESTYIELLKGRGVPLQDFSHTIGEESSLSSEFDILSYFKSLASKDRTILESGSTAFISFLRAYKESLCSYIFRMENLDIGALGRAYGLLRLPKIPETRGIRGGKPVIFTKTNIDTSKIPYLNKAQEEARIRRVNEKRQSMLEEELVEEDSVGAGEASDSRSVKTSFTKKTSMTKKSWVPPEEYVPVEEKRKRKKKQSFVQKFDEEWKELAEEESSFKRFKKGKLSDREYTKTLLDIKSDSQLLKLGRKEIPKSNNTSDQEDSDDDDESTQE